MSAQKRKSYGMTAVVYRFLSASQARLFGADNKMAFSVEQN
jgi:hypothetical protein